MNTWRDIKTDPPELNTPILVTDGESVFFGRTEKYDSSSRTAFHGANIEDGFTDSFWSDEPEEWDKLQWQPAPDTWKSEKSADEMFRELGYLWEDTPLEGGRGYENEDGLKIEVTPHGVVFDPKLGSGYVFKLGKEYVLACAQLIKEMEADNG